MGLFGLSEATMLILLLNLLIGTVQAQASAVPEQTPTQTDANGMSAEEKTAFEAVKERVQTLTRKTRADIAAVHNNAHLSADERHAAEKKIRQNSARQRKTLLEQLRKYNVNNKKKSH